MAAASGISARVWADLVPILPAARTYVKKGIAPGGSYANLRFLANWVTYDPEVTRDEQLLLCDAQTSGGLLAALSGDRAVQVVRELHSIGAGVTALIGCIDAGTPGQIHVGRALRVIRTSITVQHCSRGWRYVTENVVPIGLLPKNWSKREGTLLVN